MSSTQLPRRRSKRNANHHDHMSQQLLEKSDSHAKKLKEQQEKENACVEQVEKMKSTKLSNSSTRRSRSRSFFSESIPCEHVKSDRLSSDSLTLNTAPYHRGKAADDSPVCYPVLSNQRGIGLHDNNDVELEDSIIHTTTDSDSEDLEDINSLEKRRLQNLQDNAAFLAHLKLDEAIQSLQEVSVQKPKSKPSTRGLRPERTEKEILPRRKSLRLQRIDPQGRELPPLPPPEPEPTWEPRKKGKLLMGDVLQNLDDECLKKHFLEDLHNLAEESFQVADNNQLTTELQRYMAQVKKMKIAEKQVCKVVPNRIYSMAIHPSQTKILVCAGDKWGKLGMWDVKSTRGQDGVYMFEPHTRPIKHLAFHPQQPASLYSVSYDGSVRKTLFEQGCFDEVFALSEDTDSQLFTFDFLSTDTLLVSDSNGDVSLVDQRTNHTGPEKTYQLHKRNCKCVSIHPTKPHYFVTTAFDRSHTVSIWDLRHLSTKNPHSIDVLPHGGKSVESAFFSPITGKYLLTTSFDDRLRIYDTSEVGNIRLKHSIRHNNHTGRWLTNFRAIWHPRREDVFVVGSMERPRRIEMFSDEAKLLHTFTGEWLSSVQSINAIHPDLNVVAGGNSSGRVSIFM